MNASGQRICLNMIVRNEAPVIRRCLASVLSLIDTWVIVDTGSNDGTQEIIRDFLAALPGELFERPWVDFAHNRSEALALARGRGDYVFTIDADEVLEIAPDFRLPQLSHDTYDVQVQYGGTRYLRRQFLRDALSWRYEGVLHEYAICEEARTEALVPGLITVPFHDGARARDPDTYKKDVALLESALTKDPTNERYTFYLGQSYRDAGELEQAIRVYQRRIELGGWQDEVWYSFYQIAQLRERLEHPWPEVMEAYLTAYNRQPHRAGPLYRIGMHYQRDRQYPLSYIFLDRARQLPTPGPTALFVEHTLYDFKIALDHAVAAYYVGDDAMAIRVNNNLLGSGKLPDYAVAQVIRNRRFSLDRRFPPQPPSIDPPGITVFVTTEQGLGHELDDCLHSLLQQNEDPGFRVVVLAAHAEPSLRSRVELAPRFTLLKHRSQNWDAIRDLLREASPDDVAILLPSHARLTTPDTVEQIAEFFRDPRGSAAYAQFRHADGRLGTAAPPADLRDLTSATDELTHNSPLAVRNHVLQSASATPLTAVHLLETAGLNHLCFSDEVWTVRAPHPRPAPEPPAPPQLIGLRLPLISCLMVTLNRLALAKESILSFARQTYPERELLIVTDGSPAFREALVRFVDAHNLRSQVRFLYPENTGHTLGHLRNLAMQAARGDVLCQWDDDDINHPDRLLEQAQHMLQHNAAACFFADHLQFIEEQHAVCWIDWTLGGEVAGPDQLFPGSLMMHHDPRFRYPEEGAISRQGEDSLLLHMLYKNTSVKPLIGAGHLYLYRFHGRNTFSREHHYNLANFRKPVAFLQTHKEILRSAVRSYALPRPCYAVGREGPAFLFD